ncbi:hypothetical protein BS47DRAFT_1340605 [Hydnum rufescens UP504]|uniref:Uncharacterized protein n=1 Tax=Hydnum rufescens UP504 TaxID=1448309 RepID=A0A9P6DZG7_9AGAM|nr:hypothetical protein BS47DRAFT_1340605 [Hydnum rufescens UP504]
MQWFATCLRLWRPTKRKQPFLASFVPTGTIDFISVDEILADRTCVRRRHPPWVQNPDQDKPLASLYRLYEYYVADDNVYFRNEIEYLFSRSWPIKIYLIRLALAALPKILEERPGWALHMSPLPETFFLPNKDGNVLERDTRFASATYLAMNIVAEPPHYLFA